MKSRHPIGILSSTFGRCCVFFSIWRNPFLKVEPGSRSKEYFVYNRVVVSVWPGVQALLFGICWICISRFPPKSLLTDCGEGNKRGKFIPMSDRINNIIKGMIILFILLLPVVFYGENYPSEGLVGRVIDGDTIELRSGEIVRYIGIDAPETPYSKRGTEIFWKEATDANRKLVGGKIVKLKYDNQAIYGGRLLAYVYEGDIFVNSEMVRKGFALYSPFDPNYNKNSLLFQCENEARKNRLGIWTLPLKNPAEKYIASGNRSKKEEDIRKFHHVECPYAEKISDKNKVLFRSIDEALDEGYRPCRICKPLERRYYRND